MLGALGALVMVLRRKASVISWQVGLLALVAVCLAHDDQVEWHTGQLLQLGPGSPPGVRDPRDLPMLVCAAPGCRQRKARGLIPAMAASLIVIFICASGLANVLLGAGALGGGMPLNLANSGEDFSAIYMTAPELASARWLGEAAQPGQLVYADHYAQLRLFAMTGQTVADRRRDSADTQSARMGLR